MEVLSTYIYELKKGSKPCALITCENKDIEFVINKIKSSGFAYFIQKCVNKNLTENIGKTNIFFGKEVCISVLKKLINKQLNEISSEVDFILGIILGYNIENQCQRYLKRRTKS